mmetsp:Transcript_23359/g.38918  ORF Transcript_23359/g.38918 Transcript_23359/m.38918 type:complete len:116 (-) Transcript_23359:67-414(-)|eukprot:CAMPEP_0174978492 /NCGR_PEP_ID=MMETSP0004_2-20121128/14241_1 /TAXON_ID=420556 /ORGANISM="Ochromonas sp., Strain CCMP1393" /LENGTH=115 /DNA_ID=CAMNT_0016229885 /DNA_START=105 /DNA_END=452 /DNA_ORIENTATION=+
MARIPRHVAMDLIQFAKRVEVKAHFWDTSAKSAFEFARQLSSPKLQKQNPSFECDFKFLPNSEPASLVAEFNDGQIWQTQTQGYSAAELRAEFFDRAAVAEEAAEAAEGQKGKKR